MAAASLPFRGVHARCLGVAVAAAVLLHPAVTWTQTCPPQPQRFADVPPGNPYYPFVNTLVWHAITGGCSPNLYCPDNDISKAQMSVFLLMGRYASTYRPPPATGTRFDDVPAGAFAAAFIEKAAAEGIMGGCDTHNFCPGNPVTRGDMAVYLLKAEQGGAYVPPACGATPRFTDVPVDDPLCPWVEELARRGITGGCADGLYCPDDNNTRAQMAVFLTTNFKLPMAVNSPFGVVAAGGLANDTDMQIDISKLGTGIVRANLPWPNMERVQGTIDFTTADRLVDALEGRGGLYLYWDFSYAPCWANGQTCPPNGGETPYVDSTHPPLPQYQTALANFVTQVVSRYRGRNIYWGTWNEPNLFDTYKGGGSGRPNIDRFIAYELPTTVNAIRLADPNAKIVVGELSSSSSFDNIYPLLKDVLDTVRGKFHVVSQHVYDGNDSCGGRLDIMDGLRFNLNQWEYGSLPLWITETGLAQPEPRKNQFLQCFWAGMALRPWWSKTFWYRYEPVMAPSGHSWGLSSGPFPSNCALDPNSTYRAYQSFAKGTMDNRLDIDKSSYSDLLIRDYATGNNLGWYLRRAIPVSIDTINRLSEVGWDIVGTSDFDRDGNADWVLRNLFTGQNAIWLMDGVVFRSSVPIEQLPLPFELGGTGDFDLDGNPDLLWYNPNTRQGLIWYMNGTAHTTSASIGPTQTISSRRIVGTGHFNSDGLRDIVWRDVNDGVTEVWFMNNNVRLGIGPITPAQTDLTWRIAATADFNKDRNTDLVWSRTSGQAEIWRMNGLARASDGLMPLGPVPANGRIVGPR